MVGLVQVPLTHGVQLPILISKARNSHLNTRTADVLVVG